MTDMYEKGFEMGRRARASRNSMPANGHAAKGQETLSAVPDIKAEDIATIEDLIQAGAKIAWGWPNWFQIGVCNAVAGRAGAGKTRFCGDIIRRVHYQLPWPDDKPMTLPADSLTLWVLSDNNHDEVVTLARDFNIAPLIRINAAKADPYGGVTLETLEDYAELEGRIKAIRPAFVIIDTVGNATDKNLSRQEDAKAFYFPLQVIARRYRTAILALTHLNAAGHFLGRRVLEKCRMAIRIDLYDGEERRRLSVYKSNSKMPPALGLTMGDGGNEYDDDPPEPPEEGAGKFAPSAKVQQAVEWLRDRLAGGGRRVSHLRDEANVEGISAAILYRAKGIASVLEYETEGKKWWRLPVSSLE